MDFLRTSGLAVVAVLSAAAPAQAANPFAAPVGPPPGFVLASAHAGSHHRDGFGAALGVAPLQWLQIELSAAYRYEISIAALTRVVMLPQAALSPFVAAGANRSVTKLQNGLRYTSFSAFATVGLQARVAERWFVGAEIAALYALIDQAKVGSTRTALTPGDRFDLVPGTFIGAYFP
ncbi:MAG: hypothetical protein HYV09_33360 [Deltaproteobacteria bacterium]|nr:hypothetical protein [Deltaproteobacteria bacterium]